MKHPGPGYYPGFHTLDQRDFWDKTTEQVILNRVANVPEIRFFQPEQVRLMAAVCGRILPQDDRDATNQIPIVPWIDERLFANRHDGYRYEDMPPDREAYELGLRGIQEIAYHLHGRDFCEIEIEEQERILETLHDARPPAAHQIWEQVAAHRFWMLLVQDCVEVYYSHPWAWDEIGFGGPAYPRGYMRLERGEAEPWEKAERRHEWDAPESAVSDKFAHVAGQAEHLGGPQGGTH